jgi:hypothetical protein
LIVETFEEEEEKEEEQQPTNKQLIRKGIKEELRLSSQLSNKNLGTLEHIKPK